MKPLFIKKDGTVSKVSGIVMNLIPSYTLAEYNALEHRPVLWIRTDSEYGAIPAQSIPYDDSSTGLGDNVQNAIDSILPAVYPVGSIYLNTNNVNPATFLGFGTWTLMSDGYLRNNASAASGGSATSGSTALTTKQIPSHSHTATTQSTGAHTHTATTQSAGNHTHTATTGSYGNHTHTATTQRAGDHSHYPVSEATTSGYYIWTGPGSAKGINVGGSTGGGGNATTTSNGAHTHTLTTQNTGAHTHTLTTQNTGAHTHTLTTQSVGNHSHTLTTQSIGGGEGHTHSIEPPYIRVYAFERTA